MDILTRWKLGEKLNEEEAITILNELFAGADKKFIFDSETKIDQRLYRIYENFEENKHGTWVLNFSTITTDRPFVSFEYYKSFKCIHEIKIDSEILFVYE